jgi:glycerol-3-phosphate dehydrogenase
MQAGQTDPNPHFDVAIVGGGINGAGLARDLALRAHLKHKPLRILLLEKSFWSAGTSGKNSHLIHGGLRYLKYMDFALVREALRERSVLLKLASHAVRPLRFDLPLDTWFKRLYYCCGISLYDLLATGHRIGKSKYFGNTLTYWDAASDSAALVIDNVRDAQHLGADCRPRTKVAEVQSNQLTLEDGTKIHARAIVDARGPWMPVAGMRLVRGSHIVVPRLYEGSHAIAHFHTDGRIIFFIPWAGVMDGLQPLTLIGTTDVDHDGSPDQVNISDAERQYLLAIARNLFPNQTINEIVGEFSSLRPLVAAPGKSASATSREHRIEFGADGILRIEGGKYTTYRSMAEEAADKILARIEPSLADFHPTRTEPFRVPVNRPKDLKQRIQWAKREEGCRTAHEFLTCSTNWAWQKRWTPEELNEIEEELAR